MVKSLTFYLIIDWGFTRFKQWFLDENGKIIKESFSIIKDINKNPQFYRKKELDIIFKNILNFIEELNLEGKKLVILSSCQMHGIAGLFENSEPFFSTWNDLPIKNCQKSVESINGTPSLISMPNNKLFSEDNYLLFFSDFIKKNISREPIKVKSLMTPFELIYKYYFGINLPTSKYLWESTCTRESFLSKKIDKTKSFSASSYIVKKSEFFKNVDEVKFFPEMGDLQASTFSSINNSDIVFNWGTGSQIIFNNSFSSKTNFYRDFPKLGHLPVISHIPCGRLLNEYCSNTIYDFKDLIEVLKTLNYIEFLKIINKSKKDLLFFPGFNFSQFEYTNNPPVTIKDISTYSPKELLCNWLNQYKVIVDRLCIKNKISSPMKVVISGQLGGISIEAIKLLNEIFPKNFDLILSNTELAQSLLKCSIP